MIYKVKLFILLLCCNVNLLGFIINGLWINIIPTGILSLLLLIELIKSSPKEKDSNIKNQSSSYRKPGIDRDKDEYYDDDDDDDDEDFEPEDNDDKTELPFSSSLPAKIGAATKCPNCGFYGPNLKNSGCEYPNICESNKWESKYQNQHLHQHCLNCSTRWIRIKSTNDECYC